jgi:hypothetical protein
LGDENTVISFAFSFFLEPPNVPDYLSLSFGTFIQFCVPYLVGIIVEIVKSGLTMCSRHFELQNFGMVVLVE